MKTWFIKFVRGDGDKQYREYPKNSQFKNEKMLYGFLQGRSFLIDYRVEEITLVDANAIKNKIADQIGALIYQN